MLQPNSLRLYSVSARDKQPLLRFVHEAIEASGARVIHSSGPSTAPFRVTYQTANGERGGLIIYAFYANSKATRNRPGDEHRFQVKYGGKDNQLHELYQDPTGLYVTLFVGINPEQGFFVGADPVLHSPTRFFISIEFKQRHVDAILTKGWYVWERERRSEDGPIEILVGGTRGSFLRYVDLERNALGEDAGHRQLLAEEPPRGRLTVHRLSRELRLSGPEIMDLIASAPRLHMAVRGWAAEEHLVRTLSIVPGVENCRRIEDEGGADVCLTYKGSPPLMIECKNVVKRITRGGYVRVDFQRTRASMADPCSRYYRPSDFDLVAACLHAVEKRWTFKYASTSALDPHPKCPGRLSQAVQLDQRWSAQTEAILAFAADAKRRGLR